MTPELKDAFEQYRDIVREAAEWDALAPVGMTKAQQVKEARLHLAVEKAEENLIEALASSQPAPAADPYTIRIGRNYYRQCSHQEVDNVARALCEHDGGVWSEVDEVEDSPYELQRKYWLEVAKIAIAAIRQKDA